MSKIKRALRAVGAKVKKSNPEHAPAAERDPMADASAAARMSMWVNAQVIAAREEGVKLGLGIDAAESLRLLAVENAEQRALLERVEPVIHEDAPQIVAAVQAFLAKPAQRFVLKAVASAPTESTDSTLAAATPTLAVAPLVQGPHAAPQVDAPPDEAAPLPH